MSYDLINKKDPRVDALFQGLEGMERLVEEMGDAPRPAFYGEHFLTDEELSRILRVSRRTLQEYRTLGVIPYYLVQGKALYKESDILKILENAYRKCREEQRWV
ncbi:helix-turn-helix domain-containing protein [Bacteroides gallinarum]|uniref:helix-turn-helix domain-containing protein n=1 Tax=Bacteroides gallinarum TaxID=376806 RepID=UPI00036D8624|nr:helix-turn-helix domain-containing protein [Bacteroides gallinarum]